MPLSEDYNEKDQIVMTLDEYFAGQEYSRQIFEDLRKAIDALGQVELRVTKSQVAFYRRKAFAWAWMPGVYLQGRQARSENTPMATCNC